MSTGRKQGPPKHQNRFAWKPNAGHKINPTEVGGKLKPYSEITGVCQRCRDQIDWKRRYGKYKQLSEPAKCKRCSKRAIRQAYHNLCAGCAKEQKLCAKCCCRVEAVVGRDISEVETEQKILQDAIKDARERDRRSLLRAMNKGKTKSSVPPINRASSGGQKAKADLEESDSKTVEEDGQSDNEDGYNGSDCVESDEEDELGN